MQTLRGPADRFLDPSDLTLVTLSGSLGMPIWGPVGTRFEELSAKTQTQKTFESIRNMNSFENIMFCGATRQSSIFIKYMQKPLEIYVLLTRTPICRPAHLGDK